MLKTRRFLLKISTNSSLNRQSSCRQKKSYPQSQKTIVFSTRGGGGEATQKSVAVAKFSVWCFNLLFQGWEANSCRTQINGEGGEGGGDSEEHVP
jgi:hypothetical protein